MNLGEAEHRKTTEHWKYQQGFSCINTGNHLCLIKVLLCLESGVVLRLAQRYNELFIKTLDIWHLFKGVYCGQTCLVLAPNLLIGSIVPLNETSWLPTVWGHVAAIHRRHLICPTSPRRLLCGRKKLVKGQLYFLTRPVALCTVSKRPVFSPSRSSSTNL